MSDGSARKEVMYGLPSMWHRYQGPGMAGGTVLDVWNHLSHKEEEPIFFRTLRERIGTTIDGNRRLYEEAWAGAQDFALTMFSNWTANPVGTIECWNRPFDLWSRDDQLIAEVIVTLDHGLRHASGNPLNCIDHQLLEHSLEAMAQGIRPGPKASGCRSIVTVGYYLCRRRNKLTLWKTWLEAVAMHNQLQLLPLTHLTSLPTDPVSIMFAVKRRQIEAHLDPQDFTRIANPRERSAFLLRKLAETIEEELNPDLVTYLVLKEYYEVSQRAQLPVG